MCLFTAVLGVNIKIVWMTRSEDLQDQISCRIISGSTKLDLPWPRRLVMSFMVPLVICYRVGRVIWQNFWVNIQNRVRALCEV